MPSTTFEEATPDTYRVKTSLRPDIYELLTVFSYEELQRRKEILSFALSTLLVPYNIEKYCDLFGRDDYQSYLRLSHQHKRSLLSEVLRSTGITRDAADALSAARHKFVPRKRRRYAYLNASTVVLGDTNISAPAVVGHVLDATRHWDNTPTAEIGIGTGLHAIAMARLHPRMEIIGLERNKGVLGRLNKNIADAGMADRITVAGPGCEPRVLGEARQVYLTAAASQEQLRRLVELGGPGTEWLVPRQLTETEFAAEPEDSWLKSTFGTYAQYCASEDWNSYCALEAFLVEPGLNTKRRSIIYDTAFVRLVA